MTRIRILAPARRDLTAGYRFYEKQAEGIGRYFLDTLYSDIESLWISAGVHAVCFDRYHRLLSKRFPGRCTIGLKVTRFGSTPFSTAGAIRT